MFKYYVVGNENLTSSTLLLTLKKHPNEKPLMFQPGQYAAISFWHNGAPTPARCFSIASSPSDPYIIQFSIKQKGKFTRALDDLKVDDIVYIRGPYGSFVFDEERDKDSVFIAGGIGIAPFMSMMRYAAVNDLSNKMTLLYSCHDQDDVPFFKQINDLTHEYKNIKASYFVSQGPIDKLNHVDISSGRITVEAIKKSIDSDFENKTFFLCGPTPFMNAMFSLLRSKNVPKNKIITEAFSQGSVKQTGKIKSWPINVYFLGALGMAAAGVAIMVDDLLDVLPESFSTTANNLLQSSESLNSRQDELDKLINTLPVVKSTAPSTKAAIDAINQANANQTTSSSTNTTSTPTTPTNNVVPAPAPSVPKCTTTQSGITTCV